MILADYSAALLSGDALKAAGFGGAIRYAGTPGNKKNTTAAEVASLKAAALQVHAVFERGTTDFTGGFNAGVTNAHALLNDATACGIVGVLFMSADQHLTALQTSQWTQYLAGAKTVLGARTGAYGFAEAMNAAKSLGITNLWQAGSRSALVPGATVYQRNTGGTTVSGIAVDINDVLINITPAPEVPTVELTDTMPTALLDPATGNFAGDGPAASVEDVLRFADASVRWLVEQWVPRVEAKIAASQAGLTADQFTTLTKDVSSAVSSAVGALQLPGVSDADVTKISDAVATVLAARLAA